MLGVFAIKHGNLVDKEGVLVLLMYIQRTLIALKSALSPFAYNNDNQLRIIFATFWMISWISCKMGSHGKGLAEYLYSFLINKLVCQSKFTDHDYLFF